MKKLDAEVATASSGTDSWLKMGSLRPAPSNTEVSDPLRLLAELPEPPSWSDSEV